MFFGKKKIADAKLDPIVRQLIRSNRRTISLLINQDAELIVKAPIKTDIEYINQLIHSKQKWIEKKKLEVSARKREPKTIANGEEFYFMGNKFPLEIIDDLRFAIKFVDNKFYLSADCVHFGKKYFELWYKKQAKLYFKNRTFQLAELHNFNIKAVKISSANSRWGSCSSSGSVNLSWRLIMAPVEISDYVICHELAHLIEMNHSANFWQIVNKMIPDYKENRKWLKDNGKILEL